MKFAVRKHLATARTAIQQGEADIILLDVSLPDGYGPNLLQETSTMPARPPIIMITAFGDIEMAVDAMKNGAHDFLQKPIELSRLEQSINVAQRDSVHAQRAGTSAESPATKYQFHCRVIPRKCSW